ncbi:hypothetical protein DRH27_02690 [Candidatus Falkowbacteria bacterium]|nr:MAG: hypothetical protein DRH27_02690 [Candidatus Falkowbacteria bacterium]
MNIKRLLFLFVFLIFFVLVPISFLNAKAGDVPIIIRVEQIGGEYLNRPLIKGLTLSNTEVMVYIDGVYLGDAHVNVENTPTNNFYFQPVKAIDPGEHVVSAVAKDKTSLTLSSFSGEIVFNTNHLLPAPTLIEPSEDIARGRVKPPIIGLAHDDTLVHVFIDGIYNGKTEILSHKSGTANFVYKPFLNLNVGKHSAWAVAEDLAGKKSEKSNVLYFTIEESLPAPIIYSPVVNSDTVYNKPFIVGLAKNDLIINVYIDHKLNGSFLVNNNESGTANFAYKPFLSLTGGNHLVYTTARDIRGKESHWSNLIYFNISSPMAPAISLEAALEEPIVKSEIIEPMEEIDSFFQEPVSPPEESESEQVDILEEETSVTDDKVMDEIGEILQQTETGEEETGAINESKEQQSKLKLNLIIFILFLAAIIAWIFWVNRELIKERKAQSDEEDKKDYKDKENENADKNLPKFDL